MSGSKFVSNVSDSSAKHVPVFAHAPRFARLSSFVLLLVVLLALPSSSRGAGVTIITHGLNSNVDDWVMAMAERITEYGSFPGTNSTCYELYFIPASGGNYTLTWRRLGGVAPADSDSGEILIKLDWRQLANDDFSTRDVAAKTVPRLLDPNFISELHGHALAELPLHLIGHSRGGSLVCEISRLLGTNGVWVDHVTTLDPHPLNNDGFNDKPIYTVTDAPCRTYENVLFHDNYFQELNLLAYGESVDGAYTRQLVNLDGGYDGFTGAHSDAHLWYHGTLDLRNPAGDSVTSLHLAERQAWYTGVEELGVFAGFHYSRIGRGDRLSSLQPDGPGNGRIRNGYNQRWDLGAGVEDNRVSLPRNGGRWANLILFKLAGSNQLKQGETGAVSIAFQWARPNTSAGTIGLYLDDDFNPYNGSAQLLHEVVASGTTEDDVSYGDLAFNVTETNSTVGLRTIYARITANGTSRYLYWPERIDVLPNVPPPPTAPGIATQPMSQTILAGSSAAFSVVVTGTPPFSFQWSKNEVALDGATNSILSLSNLVNGDADNYTIVVTNAFGAITSSIATLTLAYPPTITSQPTNGIILTGRPFYFGIAAEGTAPLSYQWFVNGRVLEDETAPLLSVLTARKRKFTFQVEVSNSFGTIRTNMATVTAIAPPKIVRAPRNLTVATGKRATFRVGAAGAKPLAYQWLKEGIPIENATNRVFIIPSAQSTNAGSYTVRLSNIGDWVESFPATLTVTP